MWVGGRQLFLVSSSLASSKSLLGVAFFEIIDHSVERKIDVHMSLRSIPTFLFSSFFNIRVIVQYGITCIVGLSWFWFWSGLVLAGRSYKALSQGAYLDLYLLFLVFIRRHQIRAKKPLNEWMMDRREGIMNDNMPFLRSPMMSSRPHFSAYPKTPTILFPERIHECKCRLSSC